MDSHEAIIDALDDSARRLKAHRDDASEYRRIMETFEMKLYSAPLIGCGTGLVLYASALKSSDLTGLAYAGVVPGIWCFFIGVCAAIFGGISYTINLGNYRDESVMLGNAQSVFLNLYDNARRHPTNGKLKSKVFTPNAIARFDEIIIMTKAAQKKSSLGDTWLLRARISLGVSALSFVLGVLIPLIFFSIKAKPLWT